MFKEKQRVLHIIPYQGIRPAIIVETENGVAAVQDDGKKEYNYFDINTGKNIEPEFTDYILSAGLAFKLPDRNV